jgi:hypothetical protein
MSIRRVISNCGKPDTNTITFGTSLRDEQSPPNIIRKTVVPATGVIQEEHFLSGTSLGTTSNGTEISIRPDFIIVAGYFNKIHADIVIIVQNVQGTLLKRRFTVSVDTYVGGIVAFTMEIIYKDGNLDNYINDNDINVQIVDNAFAIIITPHTNILYAIDIFADINIKSFAYTT